MASERFQYEYFLENANLILKCSLKEEHSLLLTAFLISLSLHIAYQVHFFLQL